MRLDANEIKMALDAVRFQIQVLKEFLSDESDGDELDTIHADLKYFVSFEAKLKRANARNERLLDT